MSETATEELVRDLKLWACSPRVPLKVQLLILEAIGRLSQPSESAPPTGPTPRCDALNKSADRAYWPKWADLAEQLERALTARSATRATIVEECAKVCDDLADDPYFRVSALMQEAARLIRALADSEANHGKG
jgi:hypothetical protein